MFMLDVINGLTALLIILILNFYLP